MASELYVETLKGLTSGANANKVIIPSGQTLIAPGHVLQGQNQSYSTPTTVNGTTFGATGITASITPTSTSNKIKVEFHAEFSNTSTSSTTRVRLMRSTDGGSNWTEIAPNTSASGYTSCWSVFHSGDTNIGRPMSYAHIDTTFGTTSEVQYRVEMSSQLSSDATVNRSGSDNASLAYSWRSSSSIILTEIAG